MAISSDVLVVGGGLAGATAALAAAEEGATVRLVSAKGSTLRFASGLVDLLGYPPDGRDSSADGDGPLIDPFDALDALPECHPYRVVGEETIREAFALFDEATGDLYRGDHTDRNALVVTHGGTVKPTARYPASVAPGLASAERSTLLVGFESLTNFDAPLAAAHLRAAGVPFDVRGVTVPFAAVLRSDASATRIARALDRDEPIDGTPARRALAGAVAEAARDDSRGGDIERVGFPALLGDDEAPAVRESLAARLGADVFEVPTGPPSLPGLRLEDRLFDALDEADVRVETGNPVVDYEADRRAGPDRISAVLVDRNGRRVPYRAEQFVLATGGLVGKGLESSRRSVREPIFGCRVPHPEDRYDWFDDDAFGDQPYARFGVVPDGTLRPTETDGEPTFENLRAAGAVLGGADTAAEKSSGGVSLATGLLAGRSAARAIGTGAHS
ncbi:MAG: glycerol-3-phosphate dehydrogenase subunit GlpB [Salinigranum sp.]